MTNFLLYRNIFKHTLKHKKEELTLVELGSHLRIDESPKVPDSDKPKSKNVTGPSVVNMMEHNNSLQYNGHRGVPKGGKVGNKANGSGTNGSVDGSTNSLKGHNMFNKSLQVYYVTYVSEAYFVYEYDVAWWVDSGATVHDEALDKFKVFKTEVKLQQGSLIKRFTTDMGGTKDIGGSVVLEEVTDEVVQQPEPKLRKSKRNRTSKNFGPEFQLYLIERTRDGVSSQHSYCFNVEDDPKTFDEAMKSQDVAFWKEAINDEMDSILGNNTWVLADLPPGCKPLGCKWIFKRKLKVDGTIKKFKARLVIQGFRQKSRIYYIDTYALVERISTLRLLIAMTSIHNLIIHQMDVRTAFLNGVIISLYVDDMLIFGSDQVQVDLTKKFLLSRLIGCLMYAMTCTRPDIAFAMGKLSRLTYTGYPSVLEGYTDASWISNTKDNSSTNGWVFLLGGGAIPWASKKQTCIL
ncbi:zinc finger, CCHC-type containing protein, partial [Tanacetum coccineum]